MSFANQAERDQVRAQVMELAGDVIATVEYVPLQDFLHHHTALLASMICDEGLRLGIDESMPQGVERLTQITKRRQATITDMTHYVFDHRDGRGHESPPPREEISQLLFAFGELDRQVRRAANLLDFV